MAWVFTRAADSVSTLNLTSGGASYVPGGKAFYSLKECMKTAGWTAIACGTGTGGSVYTDDIGPRITLALIQSTTPRAWIAMQAPNGKIVVMQKGTAGAVYDQAYWRIKVIYAGGINSDGTANQTPSAVVSANEYTIVGGGTDAAPTTEIFGTDQTTGIAHCGCDNANNYGFWATGYLSGFNMHLGTLFMDGLNGASGDDVDPCIYCWKAGQSSDQNSRSTLHGSMKGWYKNASGVWTKGSLPGAAPVYSLNTSVNTLISNMSTDPWSGNTQYIPIPYGRSTAYLTRGVFKGWGKAMILVGESKGNGSTRTLLSTMDYMQLGIYLFPWDGATTPV